MEGDRYTAPEFAAAALITIDTQRDVLDGGPLEIAGTSAALPQMRMLVDAFRAAGRPIVHVVRLSPGSKRASRASEHRRVVLVLCGRPVVPALDDCFSTRAAIMLHPLAPPLAGKL